MKKLILTAVLLLICSNACCEDLPYAQTVDVYDGQFIMNNGIDNTAKSYYLFGVLDALRSTAKCDFDLLYPNYSSMDIKDAVIKYYQDNPTQRIRPVVEVVLSGCK